MSEKGEKLLCVIREMQELFSQIGLLLRSADPSMNKDGWTPCPICKSQAIADCSYHIDKGKRWMPHYAYRFYQRKDRVDTLLFLAVILDAPEIPELVNEPFITAGWFRYEANVNEKDRDWEWWYCQAILENDQPAIDGTLVDITIEAFKKNRIIGCKALALPLIDIQDVDSLEKCILQPVLEKLKEE